MRLAALIVLCFSLSGCIAGRVYTQVATFHDLRAPVAGETFSIVPTRKQEDDLEYKTYAPMLKAELVKRGMVETEFSRAKYSVFLFYGIDNGRTAISTSPVYGSVGGGTSYSSGTVSGAGGSASYSGSTYTAPTFGVVGSSTSTYTRYRRNVIVELIDNAASRAAGKPAKVCEVRGVSEGTGSLPTVMPFMLAGMFEDFPAKSGSTRTAREAIPFK
jgi:hypothetical protein